MFREISHYSIKHTTFFKFQNQRTFTSTPIFKCPNVYQCLRNSLKTSAKVIPPWFFYWESPGPGFSDWALRSSPQTPDPRHHNRRPTYHCRELHLWRRAGCPQSHWFCQGQYRSRGVSVEHLDRWRLRSRVLWWQVHRGTWSRRTRCCHRGRWRDASLGDLKAITSEIVCNLEYVKPVCRGRQTETDYVSPVNRWR